MRSGLFTEIRNNPKALAAVILFHLVLIVLLSINLASDDKPPVPSSQKHKIIDAVAVDASKYDARVKQKELAAKKKLADQNAARKAAEKKRLQEKKKKQELKRKKAEDKKRQVEKEKQLAVEKKKAISLAKKKEAERKAKEKKLKQKKAREKKERERLVKEKKAQELKEKQRLEAEKKRREEEDRQRRAEDKAEFERALIEEERREQMAKEQAARAARLQTMRQRYIMLIAQKVENNWLRPASTSDDKSCEVIVTQTMMGDVIEVFLQACTSDVAFQRSVERAVRKASPLPLPPDPELFDRRIYFKFKPR